MKSFKQYQLNENSQTLLTEDTTASTKFEGVLVDCWNLRGSEKTFREKILGSPNTKEFLALNVKGWGVSDKTPAEQIDVLWGLAKVMKKKIKGSGQADKAGQTSPGVSNFWGKGLPGGRGGTGKSSDTSKADITIGSAQVSVKGPKALLMSGEKKESRVTVIAAMQHTQNTELEKVLVKYVDSFVDSTKTFGAKMTTDALRKADTAALAKADKSAAEIKKRGDFFDKSNLKSDGTPKKGSDAAQGLEQGISVADTKKEYLKQGNVYAQQILRNQESLKGEIQAAFKVAFTNKEVARDFAYEAMTGWEKFGARTFPKMGGGQDVGRADAFLVWDYDLKKIRYTDIKSRNSSLVTHAAKQMKMSANMKSGSYAGHFGYSFYQTIRLTVETALGEQDGLNEEFDNRVERYQELLSEGWINEGKFLDMFKKAWNWFKEKVKAVWTKLVEAVIALKKKVVEMIGHGTEALMQHFEIDVEARVNPMVRF
jgi:hypothetical protein